MKRSEVRFILILLLFLAVYVTICCGKGGRGGSRFGSGSRSTSRRITSRNTNTNRRTNVYRRSGTSRAALGFGAGWIMGAMMTRSLYGSSHYMRRRRYYNNPNEPPTVCTNYEENYQPTNSTNVTLTATYKGKFICPMYNEADDMSYCCGDTNKEYCCNFWGDPGRVAGAIIGILIFLGIVGLIIYCCCFRNRGVKSEGQVIYQGPTGQQRQPPMMRKGPPPGQPGYGPRPGAPTYGINPTGAPYPPGPGAPAYPQPGNAPYQPPPGGAYPATQGQYPPPQGGGYPPPQGGAYPPPQGGPYPPPQGGAYPPPQGGAYPPSQGAPYPPGPGGNPPYPPSNSSGYPASTAPPPYSASEFSTTGSENTGIYNPNTGKYDAPKSEIGEATKYRFN